MAPPTRMAVARPKAAATGRKCPHCEAWYLPDQDLYEAESGYYDLKWSWFRVVEEFCPGCTGAILYLNETQDASEPGGKYLRTEMIEGTEQLIWPKTVVSERCPDEVPDMYRNDYDEARSVLPYSAKSAAFLGGRVLQHLLQAEYGSKAPTLEKQIEDVLARTGPDAIPSQLRDLLDMIRKSRNIAGHPFWDQTGQLIDVEPKEAELVLDTVGALFQERFVYPAQRAAIAAQVSQKYGQKRRPNKVP